GRCDLAGDRHLCRGGLPGAGGVGGDGPGTECDQEGCRDRRGEQREQRGAEPAFAARPVPATGAGASSSHEIPHITRRAARLASPCGYARRPHGGFSPHLPAQVVLTPATPPEAAKPASVAGKTVVEDR